MNRNRSVLLEVLPSIVAMPVGLIGGHLIRAAHPTDWPPAIAAIVIFAIGAFILGLSIQTGKATR